METRMVSQGDMEAPEVIKTQPFTIAIYSQKDPYKTSVNEDALGIVTVGAKCLLVMADGMGGAPRGEEAAKLAVKTVLNELTKVYEKKHSKPILHRDDILAAVAKANGEITKMQNGARTTLTVAEVAGEEMQSFQIGDSALIVCGQKGLLKHKTTEQSPVGYALASGVIDEKTALEHPNRNEVFNVLGETGYSVEVGPQMVLASNDTILLASDGVFDNLQVGELVEFVRKESIEDVAKKMGDYFQQLRDKEKAKGLLKSDDVSFIIMRKV